MKIQARLASSVVLASLVGATLTGCGALDRFSGKSKKSGGGAAAGATAAAGGGSAMAVADDAHRPPCDAGHDGYLIYVQDQKKFEVCGAGAWAPIDLTGPKGDPGAAGAGQDEFNKAFALYKQYKSGVFRVTTLCTPKSPYPSTCPVPAGATAPDNPSAFLGSAFLCDTDTACTNVHVATCAVPAGCFDFKSIMFQALPGGGDTVNPSGTAAAPFFTSVSSANFKIHPGGKDLVKIPLTGVPAGTPTLPISTKPAKGNVQDLTTVTLAMSFPLGFQDLYTDVGRVNTPYIGECDKQGGESGYGCPSQDYDFSTTNDTDHGSSGSPLFDVDQGTVIGITAAGTDGANANYNWAIDAAHLSEIK